MDDLFARLRRARRAGFIAYLTAGDPAPAATPELVAELECAGADLVELGVPFSDPLADGPVNQAAAERALRSGTDFSAVLDIVRAIRRRSQIPLVFYSYLNPLLARGFPRALKEMADAGADGLLALDLPAEEAAPFRAAYCATGIRPIALVTPTSPPARIRRTLADAGGFVYCVSRAGVTGAQARLADSAAAVLRRARRFTSLPLALGFGISTPEQARAAARLADAVVVGSALVERVAAAGGNPAKMRAVWRWAREMADAVHGAALEKTT